MSGGLGQCAVTGKGTAPSTYTRGKVNKRFDKICAKGEERRGGGGVWTGCHGCKYEGIQERRARHLSDALLQNLGIWIADLAAIEADCDPGVKVRVLHLQYNMEQARRALVRLTKD